MAMAETKVADPSDLRTPPLGTGVDPQRTG